MKRVSLLIAMICVMAMPMARAGILLEPYVGYGLMSGESVLGDYSLNGVKFGGKAGYEMMGFFGAIQYEIGKTSFSVGSTDLDVDDTSISILAGYEFPAMLRAWVGLGISGTWDVDTQGETDYTKIIFGLGFKPIPMPVPMMDLYLNAELRLITPDGSDIDNSKEIFVSIGVPFNI